MTPKTRIVIEKHNNIAATMLPKPANGTPSKSHMTVKANNAKAERRDVRTPKIETHAKGKVLYAKIL